MGNELLYFLLGFLFSIISGYYFYRKGLRIKEPVYSIKSNNLISGSTSTLENLNISYKDYKVENLTVSKILFYNRGAETITQQDMVTINPLSISSEICKILDGSILQVNNYSNNIRARYDPSPKVVFIDFDYIDKNQGAVIQVIHTGLSSEALSINGDIRGVQKLVIVLPEKLIRSKPMKVSDRRTLWLIALVGITGLYLHNFQRDFSTSLFTSYPWPIGVLALIVLGLGLLMPLLFL